MMAVPHWLHALGRARQGVAAVEFALFSPILVLLLAGEISLGQAMREQMQVGNAARAGAAYASSHGYNQAQIIAAAQAATPLLNITVTAVQTLNACADPSNALLYSAGTTVICSVTGALPGTFVTVRTQVAYTFVLPLPAMAATTLTGVTVAQIR